MLKEIETILSNYPNFINALIAVGTLGAVIVSLVTSRYSNKPHLKGKISNRIKCERNVNEELIEEDPNEYLVLDLKNNSGIPVYLTGLNSFIFRFPFAKDDLLNAPLQPNCIFQAERLEPFSAKVFILSTKTTIKEQLREYCKSYKYPKFFMRFMNFFVYTSTNYKFRMKIDRKLLKELTENL